MSKTPDLPCIAKIALNYDGQIDTTRKIGERGYSLTRRAFIICEEICEIDIELPNATDSDMEEFLTANCKLLPAGQEIMIK